MPSAAGEAIRTAAKSCVAFYQTIVGQLSRLIGIILFSIIFLVVDGKTVLALLIAAWSVAFTLLSSKFAITAKNKVREYTEKSLVVAKEMSDIYRNINTIHLAGMQDFENERLARTLERERIANIISRSYLSTLSLVHVLSASLLMMIAGGYIIFSHRDSDVGIVVTAITIAMNLTSQSRSFSKAIMAASETAERFVTAQERLNSVVVPYQQAKEISDRELVSAKSEVTLVDVSLAAHGSERQILKNINIKIRKASIVFIVGPSGSGKTSLINLICAKLKPSTGKVLVGELDTAVVPRSDISKRVGVVSQESVLFERGIRDNIIYGINRIEEEEYRTVTKVLGIEMLLEEEAAYSGPDVGRTGQLSGGERQRILLAREILQHKPVIILDEPESGLDANNRDKLYELLKKINAEFHTTILVVSHYLAAATIATRVISVDDGEVVESKLFDNLGAQDSECATVRKIQ